MVIKLTEPLKAYQVAKGFTELTVDVEVSRSACCAIIVPKVHLGPPKDFSLPYKRLEEQGITFFISEELILEEVVSFSYQKMLGRHRIEMHGYEIQRVRSFIL